MLRKTRTRLKLYTEKALDMLNQSSWGALIGSMVAALICMLYFAGTVRTGLPAVVDILIVLGVSLLLPLFAFGSAYYLYTLILKINRLIIIAIIGTFLLTTLLPDEKFNRPFIFLELISGVLVGIALNRKSSRAARFVLIGLAVLINIAVFLLLFSKGNNHAIPVTDAYWAQQVVAPEKTADPTKNRSYTIEHLFYGSGTDKHRAEYGKGVAIKTTPVDGSAFLKPTSRLKSYLREAYWGFDLDQLPLNGRVWHPKQKGVYPLVLFVHGNHLMTEYSDAGYEYMGQLLASQGFIVVSIDENFLNESWFNDFWFSEINARAWLILKHLEYWRQWNSTPGNPFYGQVDMNNICLAGHSRGADAVGAALVLNQLDRYPFDGNIRFDFGFSIRSMIQLAPAGRQASGFEIPLKQDGVNFLILHGSHDQDVYYCEGIRSFNRVKIDSNRQSLKAMLYLYKANHGQFNTVWGVKDRRFPNQYFVNSAALLDGDDQRRIAGVYVSAFLQATLLGQRQYISLLKDCRNGFSFLPRNYYVSQYEDQSFRYIADFEEDQNLTTASLPGCTIEAAGFKKWFEKVLPLRNGEASGQENTGVFLEWDHPGTSNYPYYAIHLSDTALRSALPSTAQNLFFSVTNNSDEINQVDFSIEIITKTGVIKRAFSDFYVTVPLLKTELAKLNYLSDVKKNMPVERVLQFVQLPVSAFKSMDPAFDPSQIQQIRFVFDKQSAGSVIIDKIGYN